ncbi:PVC-type heme-binding CxxCH protein [Fuerstiella marisgermanici]|uniref:Putative membrane-bound dehydrogenase domain protein n=1 Tax=Fuerstiella marisgermanici TaxID=1891926 RepID=A0A1P8WPT4_9PLAN|nr:PVC-type heme-binding CxxCH protein [Fuerstiella marisgermanici]APZ96060.1 putative membrane-bound dehydrogenase domain protein [Fuerstiella marisgermanici]
MPRHVLQFLLACFVSAENVAAADPEPEVQSLQPGVELSLVAEHPQLVTPTGLDVDSQGRIWVVATHTHLPADDYTGPSHDEILVFGANTPEAGNDGDSNRSDVRNPRTRTAFYNATTATMDLELGPDGWVYLAERDRILRIKDSDKDGKADIEQDLVVLNSDAVYPHNGLSGLAWHPNGDLIFGLGENFANPWKLTGTDQVAIRGAGQGGVFRCSADGENLRQLTRGVWNPFGTCVRSDGEIFTVENDPGERPPCRLLHVVDGGDYGYRRQFGGEAHHPFVCWNGELPGSLPMVHPTGEAPCGVATLGRGLLVPSWGDHRIDFMPLRRRGASYDADLKTIVQGGRYFRPTCIARDPSNDDDNRRVWYLADWVDGRYNAHGLGRLWKLEIDLTQAKDWLGPLELEPKNNAARLAERLRKDEGSFDRSQLMQHAGDDDPFIARAALVALSRKSPSWTVPEFRRWSADERQHAAQALALAKAGPETWIKALLTDTDPHVTFEALKWIAFAEQKAFLPEVEAILNRSDITYDLFEAALATWNTLNDKPGAGVRDLDLLLARVKDNDSSPVLRAFALRLLPTGPRPTSDDGPLVRSFPPGLNVDLLRTLLEVNDAMLSLEVVRTCAANAPATHALLTEIADDADRDPVLRAEAVAGLAAVSADHLDLLLRLCDYEQREVREEALRCLRSQELSQQQLAAVKQIGQRHPTSSDLVQAVTDLKSVKDGRPAVEDIKAWQSLLDEIESPPNAAAGRRIFHHARVTSCSNCHRHHGRGSVVGPDLTSLGERNTTDERASLLKSILTPSADMAPEFQPRTIVLKDGRTFTGIRLRSYTKEQLRDATGRTVTFNTGDVESIVDARVSFMPNGLADTLTIRELRDLIAFLQHNADASPTGLRNQTTK